MVCAPLIRAAIIPSRELRISKNEDNITIFSGIQAKFLNLILKALNKPYEVITAADGEVGRLLHNGSWTGTIGEILREKADFAINYMTISEQRLSVVDFSPVYITDDLSFAIKKPGAASKSLAFVYPFHSTIWITGFVVLLLIPLVFLYLLRVQSPYIYVLLKLMGSILGQYTFKNRVSLRYKIITFTWSLYGMILAFSYSAVLLSVLTVPVQLPGVRNFEELSKSVIRDNYKMYVYKGSPLLSVLLNNKKEHLKFLGEAVLRNSWYITGSYPLTKHPLIDTDSAVLSSRIWLGLAAGPEEWKSNALSEDSLMFLLCAIPMKKNFCYKRKLNTLIARINSAGLYLKIIHDESFHLWLSSRGERRMTPLTGQALSCGDFVGAFFILLMGLSIAFVCFIIEIIYALLREKKGTIIHKINHLVTSLIE